MLRRFGVGGRLLLAFLGISGFGILAAAAAIYAFLEVSEALNGITQRSVPSALASQNLSRQAERIAAAAPALVTVGTFDEYDALAESISADVDRLNELLAEVKATHPDPDAMNPIERLVEWLELNLISVQTAVANNMATVELRKQLLDRVDATVRAMNDLIAPRLALMDEQRMELATAVRKPGAVSGDQSLLLSQLSSNTLAMLPLQKAEAEVASASDLLFKAGAAESLAELQALVPPLTASLDSLEALADEIDPELRAPFLEHAVELRGYAEGPRNVLRSRRLELEHLAGARRQLRENAELSRQLTEAVDGLVDVSTQDIGTASAEAASVQRFSTGVLIAVVMLSLISSGLIVWLYVSRNLIARLTALSKSMQAIATGDLKADIPYGGSDEIGGMADALTVFRDTAIEVEEANLRELQEARRRLTDAIESISEGFALYDRDDRLVVCNTRYKELLYPEIADLMINGVTFESIIRSAAERGYIKDASGRTEEWIAERIERHRNPGEPHIQQRAGGRWIQVSEHKTTNGGTVAVYTDITELKRREEQAKEASRAKSQFLANMSHELRTPMNAIIGFTRLVMRRSKDDLATKQYENLEKILVSSEHLLSLINNILDLARIEAGRTDLKVEEFELHPLVEICLRTVEPMVKSERVTLINEVGSGLPPILSDQEKLRQVLINLLSNAVKFTEKGEISVSTRRLGGQLEIAVSDTGVGIPADKLESIFEEFSQVDESSTRVHGGTGLGLTITRRLAQLIGGEVRVDSALGKGSTFTVRLPFRVPTMAVEEAAESPAPSVEEAVEEPSNHARVVLAIDDDPQAIDLLRQNLSDAGYRVVGALSGREGLEKARRLHPVAIILDVLMPGMEGWQVLRELKADEATREVPVIFLSVVDQKEKGYRLGAFDYLVKPLNRAEILQSLSRIPSQRGRLLLVDDDPAVVDLVRQLLAEDGYTIDVASDGRQALEAISRTRPDVLLLDLLMPDTDGFEVIEALHEDSTDGGIPIIVITAKTLTREEQTLLERRVLKVIEKHGLERDVLIRELQRAMPHGQLPAPAMTAV